MLFTNRGSAEFAPFDFGQLTNKISKRSQSAKLKGMRIRFHDEIDAGRPARSSDTGTNPAAGVSLRPSMMTVLISGAACRIAFSPLAFAGAPDHVRADSKRRRTAEDSIATRD